MEFLFNTTNTTTSPSYTLSPTAGEAILDHTGKLTIFEYAAVIAVLGILVLMAILFTMYGLFMKAEAHKHSVVDTLGMEGYKESLMYSGRESYSPWHSDFDHDGWP